MYSCSHCVHLSEINECLLIPDLCLNGQCLDTEESYTCNCNQGYRYDPKLLYCVDIDECVSSSPCHQTAVCDNKPGTYECVCSDGYVKNPTDDSCTGKMTHGQVSFS